MEHRSLSFIGAGNMARSIIAGLVDAGYPASAITASSPSAHPQDALATQYGIQTTTDNLRACQQADVIVLAVKPQLMAQVLSDLSDVDWSSKMVISIAAGINVERLNQMAGTSLNLVRVMPNTPSLVGKGMSGLYASQGVTQRDQDYASSLMKAVGEVCWVDNEASINGVIAAAGSAPAYFFRFMEAMQQEAIRQGFTDQQARQLVQQAALGAAEMVAANSDTPLGELREQVTSKGGTTAEALRVFDQHKISDIVAHAMQAAVSRAEQMEKEF
ncbi:pyrroline-5-carboxylate reductase [Salinivibrio sp. ES.052]|uniref:pyrroline-5-carboxylate reductase n=1 Tax=Salinivibrio sp. ES.052 TaxID=1882823 RepID=UPI00092B0951|nr:pyrroline-5-carboxylate reductase [Salinivibrio sp. ES.052]SIO42168.1 pyrroline-5-carboxylate reductase [Salinivibrio sp. ES.052]